MEDQQLSSDAIIELGVASLDTKGTLGTMDDEEGGWKHAAGLSDD